ncbi:MAG TPA: ATP-binding cassette domain-containing protein [Gammaproteobacteria bacterium]|nr:ATP-binding cassette domain-containing protein [Gammaproteobacteria bacterium]
MAIVDGDPVLEHVDPTRDKWVPGGIKAYFTKPTTLVNLLEPLVQALGWKGTYRQLVESLPHFSEDLTLTDFFNVMVALNFNNEKRSLRLNAVPQKFLPCLFVPEDGVAMLLLDKDGANYEIINGATGNKEVITGNRSPGTVYRFFPFDADKVTVVKEQESFSDMLHRFRPLIIQILILTFLYNIFISVVPIYIMLIYDKVIPSESVTMAISFFTGIAIFIFSAQLLSVARIKIIAYIGARMDKTIGESIIRHLAYLAPSYTETNTVGVQIARIKSFDNIRDFFTGNIALMTFEFPFALIFLMIIFLLGGWLGFVPLILAMIFYVVYRFANPIVERFIKAQSVLGSNKQTFLLETFLRLRDIKQTGHTGVWEEKFNNMLVALSKSSFDNAFYNSTLSAISETFMQLAALAMISLGAMLAMNDVLSLGVVIAIMMLTWKVLNPLKAFFSSLPKIEQIMSSVSQINKLFTIPTEITAERKAVVNPNEKAKIEFNRVTFRYRNELAPAILGVSFVIQPGELVCIAGRNSAGKSTMLKLILALYKPQAGNILINDMNIQQFDPIELRHTIAYMPQNNQIFYGTIKQNILLGNMVATEDDVVSAAKLAGVHDAIMLLPDQYNTRLGDQKSTAFPATLIQLIILARTYLRKASIILFDEPESGFDDNMEKRFLDVINFKRKEATIMWVTHRPSHLKVADKIMYLAGGEVALFGEAAKVLERLPRNLL